MARRQRRVPVGLHTSIRSKPHRAAREASHVPGPSDSRAADHELGPIVGTAWARKVAGHRPEVDASDKTTGSTDQVGIGPFARERARTCPGGPVPVLPDEAPSRWSPIQEKKVPISIHDLLQALAADRGAGARRYDARRSRRAPRMREDPQFLQDAEVPSTLRIDEDQRLAGSSDAAERGQHRRRPRPPSATTASTLPLRSRRSSRYPSCRPQRERGVPAPRCSRMSKASCRPRAGTSLTGGERRLITRRLTSLIGVERVGADTTRSQRISGDPQIGRSPAGPRRGPR